MFVKSCSSRPLYTLQMNQQGTSHHQYRKFQNGIPLLANCLKKPECFSPVGLCPISSITAAWPALSHICWAFWDNFHREGALHSNPTTSSVVQALLQGKLPCRSHSLSPGLTMGHFPQVTAELLESHRKRAELSRVHPGPTFSSPTSLHCHQNSLFPLGVAGHLLRAQQTEPIFSQSHSQNCQPQLRENHTCKQSTTQHFHLRQKLQESRAAVCKQTYTLIKKSLYTNRHYKTYYTKTQ